MIDLDDAEALARHDSLGILGTVEGFAEQCAAGWEIGRAGRQLPDATGVTSIVVLGMGGSGVAGDVVQALLEPRLGEFFRVLKSYGPLPEWVGRNSLVIAISHSGNTEETLSALGSAHERGARAVTISSGGKLAEVAGDSGIAHVEVPGGLQPRSALGYLALSLLGVLMQMGLAPDMDEDVKDAVTDLAEVVARCHRSNSTSENPAKDLARRLSGSMPLIYGAGATGTAAMRFKCDINEYAKNPAFWNYLPELDHNELEGFNRLIDLSRANLSVVFLRDQASEHPRVATRFEITKRLIEDRVKQVIEVPAQGRNPLARLLSLIVLTQLAAIYMAFLNDVDPGPVETLSRLKNELAAL
ncbi:MAG: glucose/mannose-6-phosphate isomerase [Actinomycetota bacterium]|nr:glucose/mannose-6-phosphate isomerase [Actinomycetota bacterium]MEA2487590.1 glucose/mannose-6-phosphate isomerase [Actinomycetota bacterium]